MHRAVLTPKRLISNLFAIRPYIVKVIPLAGIAAGRVLPVDFGHGQFTRLDRDFILQKTILSRQLWKQTERRQLHPPPRAHPRHREQGSPHPVPLLHLPAGHKSRPGGQGLFPLSGDPHPAVGAPRHSMRGGFGDPASAPHGPHTQYLHRVCSPQDGGTEPWALLPCHPCQPLTSACGLLWKGVVPTLRHFPLYIAG